MARTLRGEVIDFTAIRLARLDEEQARHVDLVAAWQARKVQLLEEAAALAHEVFAGGSALAEASERFAAFGASTAQRLRAIDQQIEDINTAIDHWRAHAPDGG